MRQSATAPRAGWVGVRTRRTRRTRGARCTRGGVDIPEFSGKVPEMGLSPDPEKRANQLANLRKGWSVNADRLRADAAAVAPPARPADPDPEPEPAPPARGLEVVDYEPEPTPEPEPPARPAGHREPAAEPAASPEHQPRSEPEPERRRGAFSELLGGFLGN